MPGLYRQIGVASTFSPRFHAVLSEADRYARRLESPLSVIHASAEHADGIERFFQALDRLGRGHETGVIWSVGDTPVDAILSACQRNGIDLLLAGALENEGEHRNFVGGVARDLLQRVPCDLLLLPKPEETEASCARVAVEIDLLKPSVDFVDRACAIATRLGAAEMVFLGVVTPFDEARSDRPLSGDRLAEIVDQGSGFDGDVDTRLLRSTTGFATCEFLQENEPDLFIAGTRVERAGRRLPTRLDWLQQVIPTNVFLLGVEA